MRSTGARRLRCWRWRSRRTTTTRLRVGLPAGLDAVTYPQPHGVGLAESRLFGEQGPIGRSLQSLLVEKAG